MASVDFLANTNNLVGHLKCYHADNYFTAHDASEASQPITHTYLVVGQDKEASGEYQIHRSAVCFDTSGLDDNCLIVSATLTFHYYDRENSGIVMIKNGSPTYPHIPAVVGDYYNNHYSRNGGSADFDSVSVITLNSSGRDWINKTGYTKFILMNHGDIDREAPAGNEYVQLYGTTVDKYPKLTVEYALPTSSPAVTSEGPCTDIQSTTMTAIGNVTDDGGGYEARGFEYYEDDSIYNSEMYAVREKGVFIGTGEYEMTINGLKPETTYKIRAWLKNVYGLVYGEWYTCTTTAVPPVPSYGIHEESNSPTINFYISEDDGMTWGQKHGPYTEDQADIEVTKLLVRGSGKKKIKFESDVLTGISASVMVKLDLKAR